MYVYVYVYVYVCYMFGSIDRLHECPSSACKRVSMCMQYYAYMCVFVRKRICICAAYSYRLIPQPQGGCIHLTVRTCICAYDMCVCVIYVPIHDSNTSRELISSQHHIPLTIRRYIYNQLLIHAYKYLRDQMKYNFDHRRFPTLRPLSDPSLKYPSIRSHNLQVRIDIRAYTCTRHPKLSIFFCN